MGQKQSHIQLVYQKLQIWLEDTSQHEIVSIIELIAQAKSILIAAEQIPEQQVKQFMDNVKYDLNEFYLQSQSDIKHSIYLDLLNESVWTSLAKITDQSQVEWTELVDDFQHEGRYHAGDSVGFGQLICQKCQYSIAYTHANVIADCIECGGKDFQRISLTP
ncbi:zinc ribbon-containing protein [Cognaticolwellia mytili]|uniref:zinc ribbon-containing protein n=1 Tax=Cognaticolwellia mytili TaxID=1888913 RepID=UPI000A178027|nr:zinc ribbon-containing protein [Cognaticolwellia mytili]